ncbi:uncharacterized protein [Dysidea avara]|uniref:uncharacterized protein isoform X2 n=1 Tax=Dysidea avara TaxID=196820 RepID=UPI003319985D
MAEETEVGVVLELNTTEVLLQQLNFDRIFSELEEREILPEHFANAMKQRDANEKCIVIMTFLRSKGESTFRSFLEVVMAEEEPHFITPSRNFLSTVRQFPGYKEIPGLDQDTCQVQLPCFEVTQDHPTPQDLEFQPAGVTTHNLTQIGDDGIITVGRGVSTYYDPVHGITLHVPEDSLSQHVEKVEVTIKVGFTEHQLDSDMIMCSATVALQSVPQVLFTKDVFLEIPHSFSSTDTSDLWFVKFKDDTDETDYGEICRGIFPPEHPYGVLLTRSFSSYVIVKGRRYFRVQLSPWKIPLQKPKRRNFCKLKQREIVYKYGRLEYDGQTHQPISSNSFWFCVGKTGTNNETDNKFLFSVAQYTPTGFQSAEDRGWSASIDGYSEITKQEANKLIDPYGVPIIPVVQYNLSPKQLELYVPRIMVEITGASKKISHVLTKKSALFQGANMCELLDILSRHSVEVDEFLRQLAIQLPVWKPVAQMLGLTDNDIDHIDYDVSSSYPGEKAYQAFLRWMQKEGHYSATYDVLLLALCRATNVNDCKSITNAWWYADQYLNKLAEQST